MKRPGRFKRFAAHQAGAKRVAHTRSNGNEEPLLQTIMGAARVLPTTTVPPFPEKTSSKRG